MFLHPLPILRLYRPVFCNPSVRRPSAKIKAKGYRRLQCAEINPSLTARNDLDVRNMLCKGASSLKSLHLMPCDSLFKSFSAHFRPPPILYRASPSFRMNARPLSRLPQQLFQERLRPCLYSWNFRLARACNIQYQCRRHPEELPQPLESVIFRIRS